jgi:hypothetical protein
LPEDNRQQAAAALTVMIHEWWSDRQGQSAGDILELWVPAEELAEFNQHIVGLMEVIHEFRPDTAIAP